MSSPEESPDALADQEPRPENSLERAFAQALNSELDRIGYPDPPARTNALAQDLGLGRMQAFRIGRGDAMPTLKSMLLLQRLGVSLDAVLDQLQESQLPEVDIEILGTTVRVAIVPGAGRTPFVLSNKGGNLALRAAKPTERLAEGEMPVSGLRFARPKPCVAVIEDEPATLQVFCSQLAPSFNAVPFRSVKPLRDDPSRLEAFDVVVLDWVLPKNDGNSVVEFLRSHTRAPIVVTTGHREESPAISGVLGMPDLYFVSKPVDGEILRAMVAAAISKGPNPTLARGGNAAATRTPSKTNA